MELDRKRAEAVASEAFRAHGISAPDAATTAEVLVSADERGKHSHGLLRLSRFIRGIEHGNVDPDGEITIVRDAGAAAALSGGSRLGPVVAREAVSEAMARADKYGISAVGVHEGNHLGMLGYYTDLVRKNGSIGLAMTNTEPAMPPYGGAEPILGTNPIAVGIPTDPPFNLDMSTASIARGTVLRAKKNGERLPEGVALDTDGEPTRDPDAALNGVIRPFGGPKGSGLAIAVEILAGGLVGASMGTDVSGTYHTTEPCTKGDLFVVVDPEALGGPTFLEQATAFIRTLKSGDRAAGVDDIRLPGEASLAAADADQVTVDDAVWTTVTNLADGG